MPDTAASPLDGERRDPLQPVSASAQASGRKVGIVNAHALRIISRFVVEQLPAVPIDRQVAIYGALAEIMPSSAERASARDIAITLSRVAANQLVFNELMGSESPSRNSQ